MAMRGPRQPIGSASWIAEERSSALQIAQSEVEEFSFSARNDVDWLNEHMAEIFSENQINVADIFKTPGKLRGKTPRTARKANTAEVRVPLSSLFSSTPKGTPNPFAIPHIDRNQTPKLKIAEDRLLPANPIRASPQKHVASPVVAAPKTTIPPADSGYHGSQTQDAMEIDELADDVVEQIPIDTLAQGKEEQIAQDELRQPLPEPMEQESPTQPTRTFHSAKEEQTMTAKVFSPMPARKPVPSPVSRYSPSPIRMAPSTSPKKSSPLKPSSPVKSSPTKSVAPSSPRKAPAEEEMDVDAEDDEAQDDDVRSPSDGSSPIRGVLRKSSLNFASLPAREPLTSNKSLGARMSRTSHLDQNRQSYYNRHTHGKSLGVARAEAVDDDEMDVDDDPTTTQKSIPQPAVNAAKTYTQRLQDRISMLGKSQATDLRMSKPIASLAASQPAAIAPAQPAQQVQPLEKTEKMPSPSPRKPQQSLAAPGAFPEEDDEDDWIAPPASQKETATSSIRPAPLPKSHSTDVMEGLHGKETISESDFVLPKQRQPETLPGSPARIPTKPAGGFGHVKSASVPALPQYIGDEHDSDTVSLKKTISVSNPTLGTVPETDGPATPSKSPSRVFRDSPLKQVKNKLSSILKSSKGLLASSAAISAEGKSSLLSPTGKFGSFAGPSVESLVPSTTPAGEPMYPDLSRAQAPVSPSRPASPARTINRKTRASAEREKREQKQKDKESREAQKLAEQMEKLEKVREKEREKARIFSKEQEKVAAMEKQLAAQKEADAVSQPAPPPPAKDAPKPTRTSPRKAKPQAEFEGKTPAPPEKKRHNADADMTDAQAAMPPPTVPRSAAPTPANRSIKRPIRPTTQSASKGKQAPTVIRVNTTSSQQSQFHPTNSVLSATLQDTLGSQPQLKSKASSASLHNKPSLQSLKSSTTSNGRPKALELAAKRKEQEEREAQRKRDAKAEMERKRAALQEEERRQEEQRRQEAQRQRERDQAEMKKSVKRQDIEKAKQTRAPPPAPRNQPNGPPDYNAARSEAGPSRPASRLDSTMHRTQEDSGRPVNAVLSNASKAPVKRPLTQEGNEEGARPCFARNGPSFQTKETKRIRMSEEFDEDELEMGGQPSQSHLKGPPVRPSAGVNKGYMPNKSIFPSGYGNAPQSTSATRDLFKATVTSQQTSQPKAARPLDMAQVSKSTIPFAPNPNAAAHAHKTPARPAGAQLGAKSAAKSATRSSPRMPNGDAIELPEIQTDDDDSDDDGHVGVAPWADSPDLRRALMRQETVDPMQIFGPPAPLNMEEVFSKSKDRFHKFRARTSSANWSGVDRLTEDDIRKDLAARDKMRRDGGWTYELSKDVM